MVEIVLILNNRYNGEDVHTHTHTHTRAHTLYNTLREKNKVISGIMTVG